MMEKTAMFHAWKMLDMAEAIENIRKLSQQLVVDIASEIGTQIGNAISGMEISFSKIMELIGQFIIDLGKALITAAVMSEAFQDALFAGQWEVAIPLGIAAVAFGTAIKNWAAQGVDMGALEMAEGGLLYGPTNIIGGEYHGARNDPELVGRMSKVTPMIQDAVQSAMGRKERLVAVIEARKLKIMLDKEEELVRRNTY